MFRSASRRSICLAIVVVATASAVAAPASEPVGRVEAGQVGWQEGTRCHNCHGDEGEGAFGPDLAGGRGLTWSQFQRAVRKPWGVMPSYTEQQLPDQDLADIFAYLKSRPPVAEPGEWRFVPAPADAPLAQRLYLETIGCGQCHEPENEFGRSKLGEIAKDVDFEYFANDIYNHTDKFPKGRMGNYSRQRLPEPMLRELYKWMVEDLGLRASVSARLAIGERREDRTTYSVTLTNLGVKDKGLAAEGLTVFVRIPKNAKVTASGNEYTGVMALAQLGLAPIPRGDASGHGNPKSLERAAPDLAGDVAVWKLDRLSAAETVTLSLALDGPVTAEVLKSFVGSAVHWQKPGRRAAGRPPIMQYRDLRLPDDGDQVPLSVPRTP